MSTSVEEPLLKDPPKQLNLPGTSVKAKLMLPIRLLLVLILWVLVAPLLIIVAILRALYMRIVRGSPSQILKYGTYNAKHKEDVYYPAVQLYKEPLEEDRLMKALVSLCAEDGIEEKEIYLKFYDEETNDWPPTGSWDVDYFVPSIKKKGEELGRPYHVYDWDDDSGKRGDSGKYKVKFFVWNGKPGKPTYVLYYGSAMKWDGSSNFNFVKELMNRYMGNPPNPVFQKPEITAKAAEKFDQGSFFKFMLMLPINTSRNVFSLIWCIVRSAKWAGGNGVGRCIAAMNFTIEESQKLYAGSKKLGATPFAAFTYAGVKATTEVLKQRPLALTQQASLQTRHFPLPGQSKGQRDLVGDWLFGPMQKVGEEYGLKEAMEGYKDLQTELDELGPLMQEAVMAKAYGLVNSGAAVFQVPPCYNIFPHCLNRCIFMNNYGTRKMCDGSPFHSWNWNAPFWFGINTINVDGATTTFVGAYYWGQEIVDAMRDNMEATLRDIMAKA